VEGKTKGGNKPKILVEEHRSAVQRYILENCLITLKRIQEKLKEEYRVVSGIATIFRAIESFNFTLKRTSVVPELRNDDRTIEIRQQYANDFLSIIHQKDGEKLFFVDEIGFNASMRTRKGRSPKGERAI
jgi:hypothetical protein